MRAHEIPEIAQMSTSEKILLVEDIWESISSDESRVPVPESHLAELEARLKSYEADPGSLLSLEELQNRISKRK